MGEFADGAIGAPGDERLCLEKRRHQVESLPLEPDRRVDPQHRPLVVVEDVKDDPGLPRAPDEAASALVKAIPDVHGQVPNFLNPARIFKQPPRRFAEA